MAGKTPIAPKSTRDTLAKVRAHVGDVERRLKSADKSTQRSVQALETAFEALQGKVGGSEKDDLKANIDELSAHLNRKLDDSRAQINQDLQGALSAPDIDHMREALSRATARLSQAERRQAESIQKVNEQIIRLATAIDNRVRNETRAREALEHRMDAQILRARDHSEQRIAAVEDHSASAILKIGSQVSQLSTDLADVHGAIEKRTEGRIYEAALDNRHEIENLKADISARLETINGPQAYVDITPVQRSVEALATRLERLESRISAASRSGDMIPAAIQEEPPFPPARSQTPLAPIPLPASATPVAATNLASPQEFDPSEYSQTRYEMPSPQGAKAENLYGTQSDALANPYEDPQQSAGLASSQMALHDYDAPADFDPYGAPQAPDYMDAVMQPIPAGHDGATDFASNPYTENLYADNPYSAGFPGEPAGNPYAPPPPPVRPGETPLNLGADMSMAAARPGADTKRPRKAAMSLPSMTPRTLRTAASAAALVAVIAAGAWMAKGRLPGQSPQIASAPAGQNGQASLSAQAQNRPGPVTITAATGLMSTPDEAAGINPSKPRIDNFASLDAAVAAGNPVAQLQKGLTLLQTGKETEAAPFIRAAANQTLPAAQYYLGNMYENGQGVPADAVQARMLTERAARAGHRIAMYDLALYYIEGKGGVEADMSMAAQWFEKAAQFGMTDAQYNLAVLYERGTGVTPDPAEAYNWYAIAGSQGDQDAARRAAQLELELPGETLQRAKSKVASFAPSQFNPETNGIFKDLPWNKTPRMDNTIANVQQLLLDLGYDAGVADGAMGPRTRDAIKAFERATGMPETGRVDDTILRTLKDVAGA